MIIRARFDPDFKDVSRRPKHHHVRCETCAINQLELLEGWTHRRDTSETKAKIDLHAAEVRSWRDTEAFWQSKAIYSPSEVVVLSYDDTSALGMPRFTNRDIKNVTTVRVQVIPFSLTNHGTSESFYFYTLKGQFKKGANRLCTTLFSVTQRIKTRTATTFAEKAQKW